MCNSFFDLFRIDLAAVAQSDTFLFLEEGDVAHILSFLLGARNGVEQSFDDLAAF